MNTIRKLLLRAVGMVALVVLPMAGVMVMGDGPIEQYLEFPPQTRYVEHADFSWAVFMGLGLGILAVCAPLVVRVIRGGGPKDGVQGRPIAARGRWPWWALPALAGTAIAWVLAWTPIPGLEWVRRFTFSPLWIGYIGCVSACTFRRTGRCLLTGRPGRFALLFPLSALFWWFFEYLNRFVQNWFYFGVQDFSAGEYVMFATLPFATVLPAVMATRELLWSFPRLRVGLDELPELRVAIPRWCGVSVVLSCAAAGLFLIGRFPNQLFPLLWISPLLVLAALEGLSGERVPFEEVLRGDWRDAAMLALAALVCGWFWEMWNYFSLAGWEYAVPFVQRFQVWEMPILGYAGYLPFGLECGLLARWVLETGGDE